MEINWHMQLDSTTLFVAAGVGVVLLGVIYFAVRFWLVSTRPADIRDVPTPALDRRNFRALEQMAGSAGGTGGGGAVGEQDDREGFASEEDADEEAPAALKLVVPPETPGLVSENNLERRD